MPPRAIKRVTSNRLVVVADKSSKTEDIPIVPSREDSGGEQSRAFYKPALTAMACHGWTLRPTAGHRGGNRRGQCPPRRVRAHRLNSNQPADPVLVRDLIEAF